ncbi:MAG: hypothetical protein EOM80_18670 [Erysipelotrichia bacterium]|nr:hypothetical protein [Erysipelotrichia bacterium]
MIPKLPAIIAITAAQVEHTLGLALVNSAPTPATRIQPMEATSNTTPPLPIRPYDYVLPLGD